MKAKINSHASGQFSHAEDVLPALYELMESEEPVGEASLPIVVPTNQQVVGEDWDGLKKALTSSLISGTSLSSQFYAVESRSSTGSPRVRLIYFCSAVGGSFASNLVERRFLTQTIYGRKRC